jgi:hypothetical protein
MASDIGEIPVFADYERGKGSTVERPDVTPFPSVSPGWSSGYN